MIWKRLLAVSGLLSVLAALGSTPLAQEEEEPKPPSETDAQTEQVKEQEEAAKPWGDRMALYVEASYGSASAADVDSSLITTATRHSSNTTSLDNIFGRAKLGWRLPADRGVFLISFSGYKEDSYTFSGVGSENAAISPPPTPGTDPAAVVSNVPLTWWTVQIADGRLVASRRPPLWTISDDRDGNGRPDPGEVRFDYASPCPPGRLDCPVTVARSVPDNLQNRLQTVDGLFQRDFGGRRFGGRWTAGLRYFVYEGNIPTSAWLSISYNQGVGLNFTDGTTLRLLRFSQEASGLGPTGSLEFQSHFFRRRLTFYGQSRFAFILESVKTDSGPFFTIALDPGGLLLPAPARLQQDLEKSTWHFGVELGARVRLLEGLHVELAFNRTSYQDVLLLPVSITIPEDPGDAPQGTVGLYKTQDLEMDTVYLGLGYQF